jgi:uncharacterized protein YegL
MELIQTSEYLIEHELLSISVDVSANIMFNSPPTRVVLVIDISGSMGTEVVSKSQTGNIETSGYTQLDIVKHASYTILENLRPQDSIAVIAFTSNAREILPMTPTSPENKSFIKSKIQALYPEASTNLWDGLLKGMETIRLTPSNYKTNDAIFLLTDGQPNVDPPRGYSESLRSYLDTYNLNFTINTFGFGYSLDCKILKDISIIGNGHYGFIPDGSFVGTIFINAMANLMTVMARNLELHLTFPDGNVPDFHNYPYPTIKTSWGYIIKLGSFRYGQPRNITFPLKIMNPSESHMCTSVLKYTTFDPFEKNDREDIHFSTNISDDSNNLDIPADYYRIELVKLLEYLSNNVDLVSCQLKIQELTNEMISSVCQYHVLLQGFVADLTGQITEACSRSDWYARWGKYYMKSLQDAHLHQHCNNFKDPGVSNYGGEEFKEFQKHLENIFIQLPVPTPSLTRSTRSDATYVSLNSMASYCSSSNPCWLYDSEVLTKDNKLVKIQDLKKGNLVLTKEGTLAKVVCLIETQVNNHIDYVSLVNPTNKDKPCRITPWHPVWNTITNSWMFPVDVCNSSARATLIKNKYVLSVFNLVLESHHSVVVDGWTGITLGHSASGNVLSHSYLGTDKVIKDLAQFDTWESGKITLDGNQVVRNENTSMIDKFVSKFTGLF